MSDKFVTVARYPHPNPAHMAKSYLESQGIGCQLLDEASSQSCCGSKTEVLLRVARADADRVREILAKDPYSARI